MGATSGESGGEPGRGVVVSVDGRIVRGGSEVAISPLDRGFLYGEAVYESLRTYGGRPFLLDRHLARLRGSAAWLGITPFPSDDEIETRAMDALRAASDAGPEDASGGEQTLSIVLTAGWPGRAPTLVVLVRPLAPQPADSNREAAGVLLTDARRVGPGGVPPGVKTTCLVVARRAAREALAVGAEEALLRGPDGCLAEGSRSNLFIVEDGVVRTPDEGSGVLPGITRSLLIDALRDAGIPCEEERIPPARLESADEVFLTGSSREVSSVGWAALSPDGPRRTFGEGHPGPITLRALSLYRDRVKQLLG